MSHIDRDDNGLVLSLVGQPSQTDALLRGIAYELARQDYNRSEVKDYMDSGHVHDLEEEHFNRLLAALAQLATREVQKRIRKLRFEPAEASRLRVVPAVGPGDDFV